MKTEPGFPQTYSPSTASVSSAACSRVSHRDVVIAAIHKRQISKRKLEGNFSISTAMRLSFNVHKSGGMVDRRSDGSVGS